MTSDEKAQQIGRIVTEYQTTKVDLAHVEGKLKAIGAAYTQMGSSLGGSQSGYQDFKIEGGHIVYRYQRSGGEQLGQNLLGEEGLIGILNEREKLQKKLAELREQLRTLGITNLE